MEKTSLSIKSNIILKEEYDKDPNKYLPSDLLQPICKDVEFNNKLTKYQQEQQIKQLFYTEKVIDEDSEDNL